MSLALTQAPTMLRHLLPRSSTGVAAATVKCHSNAQCVSDLRVLCQAQDELDEMTGFDDLGKYV